jgi:hypothetical protein
MDSQSLEKRSMAEDQYRTETKRSFAGRKFCACLAEGIPTE